MVEESAISVCLDKCETSFETVEGSVVESEGGVMDVCIMVDNEWNHLCGQYLVRVV